MTPSDWIAVAGMVGANTVLMWRFTLKVEHRLTRIEAVLGIRS